MTDLGTGPEPVSSHEGDHSGFEADVTGLAAPRRVTSMTDLCVGRLRCGAPARKAESADRTGSGDVACDRTAIGGTSVTDLGVGGIAVASGDGQIPTIGEVEPDVGLHRRRTRTSATVADLGESPGL